MFSALAFALFRSNQDSGHSRILPVLPMLKHRTPASKTGRDRKRGRTAYSVGTLGPPDVEKTVEDVRVWDVTASERTGRVSASRRNVTLHHQALSQSEEPSTSVQSEVGVEEAGAFADSEAPPKKAGAHEGRKRVRTNKDNDSVSEVVCWHVSVLICVSRRGWNSGFSTARFFWMNFSASMASATRRTASECVQTVRILRPRLDVKTVLEGFYVARHVLSPSIGVFHSIDSRYANRPRPL